MVVSGTRVSPTPNYHHSAVALFLTSCLLLASFRYLPHECRLGSVFILFPDTHVAHGDEPHGPDLLCGNMEDKQSETKFTVIFLSAGELPRYANGFLMVWQLKLSWGTPLLLCLLGKRSCGTGSFVTQISSRD